MQEYSQRFPGHRHTHRQNSGLWILADHRPEYSARSRIIL